MSTYLLIHGAWHGAWCWFKIIPYLENKGHKVITPNLPGHGIDKTLTTKVSLKAYIESIGEILLKQSEPLIIVGHSMGGIIVSSLAELYPDQIELSVYLAAFLLQSGQSLMSIVSLEESLVTSHLRINAVTNSATVDPTAIKTLFYHDCSPEDVSLASLNLVPQNLEPFNTSITFRTGNFERVKRVYIETTEDRAINPSLQKLMYSASPCERVITFNTSHSPFFSEPLRLAKYLDELSNNVK